MLTELKDRREYINNPQKAINRHSVRYYNHSECYRISGYEDGTTKKTFKTLVLDRNLSTNPSYFTYYVVDENGKVIYGKEIKGVTTWKKAEQWLEEYH